MALIDDTKGTFKSTFKNINNIKREVTLKHDDCISNPTFMKALLELELHVRSLQSQFHEHQYRTEGSE